MDAAQDLQDLIGRKAVDREGDKIGTVEAVYLDDQTNEPTWLTVTTGWFGGRISYVPFEGTYIGGDDLVLPYRKDHVRDAPNFPADGHLSPEEEERLYDHYGIRSGAGTTTGGYGGGGNETTTATTGRAATNGDRTRTDDAMTRSEEELDVSKRQTETGRARLRKWIETEQVQMTVPIRREKARLVTEPITESNRGAAMDGPELTESEHEVVLNEEQVQVNKQVVPKERVRLEKDVETENVPVDETVRKERLEMDTDDARSSGGRR